MCSATLYFSFIADLTSFLTPTKQLEEVKNKMYFLQKI